MKIEDWSPFFVTSMYVLIVKSSRRLNFNFLAITLKKDERSDVETSN